MKKMKTISKIGLMIIITLFCFCSSSVFADVSLNFRVNYAQWQQNVIYDLTVYLHNNEAAPVKIAGVQVDFNYDSMDFKGLGNTAVFLVEDYITGYTFATNTIDRSNEGYLLYQKAISVSGSPNYFTIGANADYNVATFRFRVESGAVLGSSGFTFRAGADVTRRLNDGGVESVLGDKNNGLVTLVLDSTPPNTYASPAGRILRYGDSTLVVLDETEEPNYDDLLKVYYETGTPTAANPTTGSIAVSEGESVQLPVNTEGSPGKIEAELKFFGEDGHGNLEYGGSSWHTETYTVDIIQPTISSAILVAPADGNAKLGEQIRVTFSVDEELGEVGVTVNGHSFTDNGSSHPNYDYIYTTTASDAQGTKSVVITVEDLVGNTRSDSSVKVKLDFNAPTYTPVSFLPVDVSASEVLTIKFNSSEPLDIVNTKVYVAHGYNGGEAVYSGVNGSQYTYTYAVTGDETSTFVKVHGYDEAGNDSWNIDDWNLIEVSGKDQYNNPGIGSATVGLEWRR